MISLPNDVTKQNMFNFENGVRRFQVIVYSLHYCAYHHSVILEILL